MKFIISPLYLHVLTAPSDYEGEVQVLEIFGNGERTVSIDINDDSEVEDTESFFVNITTTDDYVNILIDSTQVLIGDNGEPANTHKKYLLLMWCARFKLPWALNHSTVLAHLHRDINCTHLCGSYAQARVECLHAWDTTVLLVKESACHWDFTV